MSRIDLTDEQKKLIHRYLGVLNIQGGRGMKYFRQMLLVVLMLLTGSLNANNGIVIKYPDSNTTWKEREPRTSVMWKNVSGSKVRFELYKGGKFIADYHGWTDNDGYVERTSPLPGNVVAGNGYRIQIISDIGENGWSEPFEILPQDQKFAPIGVTYPNSKTMWRLGQERTFVEWHGLSGQRVHLELFRNGQYVGEYHAWTDNDGHVERTSALPWEFGTGDNFRIKIVNEMGNYIWSEPFKIVK